MKSSYCNFNKSITVEEYFPHCISLRASVRLEYGIFWWRSATSKNREVKRLQTFVYSEGGVAYVKVKLRKLEQPNS